MSERIEIPAEKLHEEMLKLRQGKHMDFLRSLTGMDWGEEGVGVFYPSYLRKYQSFLAPLQPTEKSRNFLV